MPVHARISGLVLGLVVFSGLVVVLCSTAEAQSISESQVKAAYLYSFAKFVEWPVQKFPDAATPILFCVVGDPAFELELNQTVKGKSISGRAVKVQGVQEDEPARDCHVLFFNSTRARQTRHLLEAVRGAAVLSVGEADDFIQAGGMIRFVLRDDRVQFEVNHKTASQEGLYISARLLGVARRIFD